MIIGTPPQSANMRNPLPLFALISILLVAQPALGATNGLDLQFGSGGVVLLGPTPVSAIAIDQINGMAIQDDGKIVIVGRTTDLSGPGAGSLLAAIGRLNSDGSWDTSFGDHGLFVLPYGVVSAPNGGEFGEVAVLSDHGVIAAGATANNSGTFDFKACVLLAKVGSTGTLSTTFAPDHSGSFCYNDTGASRISHFEALVAGASDTIYVTSPTTSGVAHFDSNGALIATYGNSGVAALPVGTYANLLQPVSNDLLAIGVSSGNSAISVVRLDSMGSTVIAYGSNGVFTFDQQLHSCCAGPTHAALDAHGRLLIADNDLDGGAINLPYRVARLTDAGALDVSFNESGQQAGYPGFAIPTVTGTPYDNLLAVQPLPDGHLLAAGRAGYATAGDGTSDLALLRLNDDASYDMTFGDAVHPGWASINILGTANSGTGARALAVDSSNRAFVAISTGDGSQSCKGVVRLIPDRLFEGQFDSPAAFPTCP